MASAQREWIALERHLRATLRMQTRRLEEAMIEGRRWGVADFEALLGQPLMGLLARGVVWGGYDRHGERVTSFRVTDDGCCVGLGDDDSLDEVASVGVVHPVELSDEELDAWREALAQEQPFAQLDRPTSSLPRHVSFEVQASQLWRALRARGWTRAGHDAGVTGWAYVRRLGDATAVLEVAGTGAGATWHDEWLRVRRCFFLGDAGAAAVSEVGGDLEALSSQGRRGTQAWTAAA